MWLSSEVLSHTWHGGREEGEFKRRKKRGLRPECAGGQAWTGGAGMRTGMVRAGGRFVCHPRSAVLKVARTENGEGAGSQGLVGG